MIKAMDELLQHWADQHRGQGMRQCSPLGRLVEFGGIPPRSGAPQGSRDPLNLGDMDELAWQVEQALQQLEEPCAGPRALPLEWLLGREGAASGAGSPDLL